MTITAAKRFCDVCGKEIYMDCLCRLNDGVNDMLRDAINRKSAKRSFRRRHG